MNYTKSRYEGNDKELTLLPTACWHVGHVNYQEPLVKEWVDKLDYTHRGLLLGDLAEFATKHSVGKALLDTNMTPKDQREYIIELLRPKAEFIDGAVIGNHEERGASEISIDIIEDVCKALNIPYLHYQGIVKYAWNGCAYSVNIWHGTGNGTTAQAAINTCEKMAERTFADVYCIAHFHKNLKSDRVFNYPDTRNNKIVKVKQQFVCVGSALGYDEGYADMKGLTERGLGFPTIKLHGEKGNKNVKVEF